MNDATANSEGFFDRTHKAGWKPALRPIRAERRMPLETHQPQTRTRLSALRFGLQLGRAVQTPRGKRQSLPRSGKDGFHSVPNSPQPERDGVESVLTRALLRYSNRDTGDARRFFLNILEMDCLSNN